ncbi:Polyketide cyclase / dehydrase and lipid transport [Noviherbaspirillum humi]|uniref:Polyketide cyclase / dehydrase and lipid transport n=1 Tax=Noviherbaspirillum humi TaxID=1688639 RepID=A0A239HYW6_9BURK|nr:SRPBCC family protein [Noviherbaspirillum humi]SNS86392.1 Polyketide cyclase / dehydrase and lipid transport [Noviherbaspirillum humi]
MIESSILNTLNILRRLCWPLALALALVLDAGAADLEPPAVQVRRIGESVVVEASVLVPASVGEVWSVLIDYDHMADMFPDIESSRVLKRSGNQLQVEQKGAVRFGPFSVPFESIRDIQLFPPREVRSSVAGGSLRSGTALTRLVQEEGGVRVVYYSESVPNVWTPPGLGPHFIARQTRTQFENLRAEILRRKAG